MCYFTFPSGCKTVYFIRVIKLFTLSAQQIPGGNLTCEWQNGRASGHCCVLPQQRSSDLQPLCVDFRERFGDARDPGVTSLSVLRANTDHQAEMDVQPGKGQSIGKMLVVSVKDVKHRWRSVLTEFTYSSFAGQSTDVITLPVLIICFLLQSQCFKLFTTCR